MLKLKPPSAAAHRPAVITWNCSCGPLRLAQPEQTCVPLTQLALGLIIIFWRCVYFCCFRIPNYFCYSNIILALMPQILYLNSVRFPLSLPSEDCSCKIHGLRVGITQASRGGTYQVHQPLPHLCSPPCSLPLYWGRLLGNSEGETNMNMCVTRVLDLCKCIFVLGSGYQGRRTTLTTVVHFYESPLSRR